METNEDEPQTKINQQKQFKMLVPKVLKRILERALSNGVISIV